MRIQFLGTVLPVKTPRDLIRRLHIHANPTRLILHKPFRHTTQEFRRDSAPPSLLFDGDPLQLPLALKAAREMPGHQAHNPFCIGANECRARPQCLFRADLLAQIPFNPLPPVLLGSRILGADLRHLRDVTLLRAPAYLVHNES